MRGILSILTISYLFLHSAQKCVTWQDCSVTNDPHCYPKPAATIGKTEPEEVDGQYAYL